MYVCIYLYTYICNNLFAWPINIKKMLIIIQVAICGSKFALLSYHINWLKTIIKHNYCYLKIKLFNILYFFNLRIYFKTDKKSFVMWILFSWTLPINVCACVLENFNTDKFSIKRLTLTNFTKKYCMKC